MTGSIIWKSAITVAVLAWALLNIVPAQDTPFDDYIKAQVSAQAEAYGELHQRALARTGTEESQEPTFFVALKKIVSEDSIDLQSFFPDIDASDVKNLDKRNDLLLRELLKRSQGKVKPGLDLKGGVAFIFKVKEEDLAGESIERQEQLEQAIEIIRKRVDGLGVAVTADATADVNLQPADGGDLALFIRSDANNDGRPDLADGIYLINEMFYNGPAAPCPAASDANSDGSQDLTDAMFIFQYWLQPNATPGNLIPAPAAPFPACGTAEGITAAECPASDCSS